MAAWNEAVANDYSNLPNGEFTDSLIQEGDNLPNGDMELPDPVNSLTETTAETTVTEITISPAGAENSPSQPDPVVAFPETDNPDSVSNGPSEEVIEPLPSAGDYVADVLQRQSAKASFTVPPAASGADSFSDGPVTAYCQIINVSPDELKDKERAKITKVCRRIGERRGVDAAFLADSILMLPESDWAGRCNWFTINPYAGGVEDVINALVARRLSGGPVLKVASRAPPDARTAADYEEGDEVL